MTERGESPPHGGHNEVGEGAGHKVKRSGKGGYARSSHHEGLAGPRDSSKGSGAPKALVHTGYHSTDEHKGHGSAHKLPMEKHVPFNKGIAAGDHFESEIKEHFPNNRGVAGINKTGMPKKGDPTPNEGVSHSHGKPSGKAEHHPGQDLSVTGPMYEHAAYKHPQGNLAHGYGHDHEQRKGFLRLSGHKSAHRLGSRSSRSK